MARAPSVFPQGGAVYGVSAGLEPSGVVAFEVLPPGGTDGHLVEIAEL